MPPVTEKVPQRCVRTEYARRLLGIVLMRATRIEGESWVIDSDGATGRCECREQPRRHLREPLG